MKRSGAISYPSDVAFTPTVKAIQSRKGSRQGYASMEERGSWETRITPDLAEFIGRQASVFLGTANAEGQPYIQHRGGPPGFLKVLDDRTLGFADFSGNRQYLTVGNLSENPKAFIFLMDYANSQRIKVWGTAKVVEGDPGLLDRLSDPEYPGRVERAILFTVESWDLNCPQHIHRRFAESQIAPLIQALEARVEDLESRLAGATEKARATS